MKRKRSKTRRRPKPKWLDVTKLPPASPPTEEQLNRAVRLVAESRQLARRSGLDAAVHLVAASAARMGLWQTGGSVIKTGRDQRTTICRPILRNIESLSRP